MKKIIRKIEELFKSTFKSNKGGVKKEIQTQWPKIEFTSGQIIMAKREMYHDISPTFREFEEIAKMRKNFYKLVGEIKCTRISGGDLKYNFVFAEYFLRNEICRNIVKNEIEKCSLCISWTDGRGRFIRPHMEKIIDLLNVGQKNKAKKYAIHIAKSIDGAYMGALEMIKTELWEQWRERYDISEILGCYAWYYD